MERPRSDFNWDIIDTNVVYIEDLNLGRMSVTNECERVCASIRQRLDVTEERMRSYCIFYKDSEGEFTGVDYRDDECVNFYGIPATINNVKDASQWVQQRQEVIKNKRLY